MRSAQTERPPALNRTLSVKDEHVILRVVGQQEEPPVAGLDHFMTI
jgi:hypothetical protein